MTDRLFGTDGMRGEAGQFPLDAGTVRITGRSLARHLQAQSGRPPRLIVGRDTRESSGWIARAFIEGASAAGATAESAGVITTPGVAYLAKSLPADAGVVISASHNPYQDNGIKIFSPSGRKLDEAIERLIEADIASEKGADTAAPPPDREVAEPLASSFQAKYVEHLAAEVAGGLSLDGLRLALDCANGAASDLAPALFARLGAAALVLNHAPNGRNINLDCGSLHLEGLCRRVVAEGMDLGVAYDGDADRALFVNHRGEVVDGDATLWAMATYFEERGELEGGRVVATVMSNIGLERALRTRGLTLLRTNVGDKYVLEELLRSNSVIGGEQSGHLIFPRVSLAGDGLLTTLYLLRAMRERGESLEQLTAGFVRYPQVLLNVRVREKRAFAEVPEIARAQREVEEHLGESGRLLLRYSGTEPLARVMIEGESREEIERLANRLAETISAALG